MDSVTQPDETIAVYERVLNPPLGYRREQEEQQRIPQKAGQPPFERRKRFVLLAREEYGVGVVPDIDVAKPAMMKEVVALPKVDGRDDLRLEHGGQSLVRFAPSEVRGVDPVVKDNEGAQNQTRLEDDGNGDLIQGVEGAGRLAAPGWSAPVPQTASRSFARAYCLICA